MTTIVNGVRVRKARSIKMRDVSRANGSNRFCGPAIVSALTGHDTSEASAIIRSVGYQTHVRGTSDWEIERALRACGIEMVPLVRYSTGRPTLAKVHRTARKFGWFKRDQGGVLVVTAGRHWQLVSANRYVCGQTGEMVSIRDKRVKRRARVHRVWSLRLTD